MNQFNYDNMMPNEDDSHDRMAEDLADKLMDGKNLELTGGDLFLFIAEMRDPSKAEKVIYEMLKENQGFRADMRDVIRDELLDSRREVVTAAINKEIFNAESP